MGKKNLIACSFILVFALFLFPADLTVADNPNENVYDLADFAMLAANWLETLCLPPELCDGADYTRDGTVGVEDLEYLADYWLRAQTPTGIVLVPGGEFQMGDSFAEGPLDERPVHAVLVGGFYMDRYEITNKQYCDYLNDALSKNKITVTAGIVYKAGSGTPYPYCDTTSSSTYSRIAFDDAVDVFSVATGKADHPMVMVSWYGAAAYANWRSLRQGLATCYSASNFTPDLTKHGYRLPTEAEWEYAARGGPAGNRYPWGDDIVTSQANYRTSGDPYETGLNPLTTPVGFYTGDLQQKSSYNWPGIAESYQTTSGVNGYGLFDMAGNAWEWCNDWYSDSYYSSSPHDNPPGPASGDDRVLRGGAWYSPASNLCAAYRSYIWPDFRGNSTGFRLILIDQ